METLFVVCLAAVAGFFLGVDVGRNREFRAETARQRAAFEQSKQRRALDV